MRRRIRGDGDRVTVVDDRPLVLAVGHFPPPIHGMAVATERFVEMLSERANVRILAISAPTKQGMARHLKRMARTAGAIARMLLDRRQSDALYVGSDAGLGMSYTLAVVLAGRILRYRTFLHHHSAAYVNKFSWLMAAIVGGGGRRCVHVLSCQGQAQAFADRYRPPASTMVVLISYALRAEDGREVRKERSGSSMTLGYLSNISVEKGLRRVFETLSSAVSAGLDARLLLAGPAATAQDEAALFDCLAGAKSRAVYLGPVENETKRQFFTQIDVFLFPSRYRHESFGLVAGEAMQAGIPVIAYRAGCLDAQFVGDGGLVVEPLEDFPRAATKLLRRWQANPHEMQACAARARSRIRSAQDEAKASADALIEKLVVHARPPQRGR